MTIAVDLGRKTTKPTNLVILVHQDTLHYLQLIKPDHGKCTETGVVVSTLRYEDLGTYLG